MIERNLWVVMLNLFLQVQYFYQGTKHVKSHAGDWYPTIFSSVMRLCIFTIASLGVPRRNRLPRIHLQLS